MSAFVDTSAFHALLVHTEHSHGRVSGAFDKLLGSRRALWTTSYTLLETCTLLQRRFGLASVREFHEKFYPLLTVVWVSDALHHQGMDRLSRADRRHVSLVDCVSFELMVVQGLQEALTLDPHFEEAGFRVLPR